MFSVKQKFIRIKTKCNIGYLEVVSIGCIGNVALEILIANYSNQKYLRVRSVKKKHAICTKLVI